MHPYLFGKLTEEPITSALRLTICLYRLGIGDHLYTISEMSRLGVSTVSSICQEVCQVLVDHLWNETVSTHMPQTEEEFKQKILDMEEFWQFPCCWKAINGSRIPMKAVPVLLLRKLIINWKIIRITVQQQPHQFDSCSTSTCFTSTCPREAHVKPLCNA